MNAHASSKRALLTAMALVVVSSFAAVARAGDVIEQNVAQRIATAKTPEEHEAIAAFLKVQAVAAGEKVKEHGAMLASYQSATGAMYRNALETSSKESHCRPTAATPSHKKLQEDYEALAAPHQKMVKGSRR